MSKAFYIQIDDQKVSVTEEIYRAFKRPVWTERKRRAIRVKRERSLETFSAGGFEISSDNPLVEKVVTDKLLLEALMSALDKLTDNERSLIDALFFQGKSEREVARVLGISQPAVHKKRNRIIERLKKMLS